VPEELEFLSRVEESIGSAVERAGPAVVGVGRGRRSGSGVVIAPQRVLTGAHTAVEGAPVIFGDGRRAEASAITVDRELGLAVLDVETGDASPLQWVDSSADVAIGRPVIALANPGGRGLRATLGFVSSIERSFRGWRGRRIGGAIEHTAPLPRGSAGGPLLTPAGEVLGINALRLEGGLILALGADAVRGAVDGLARGEEPRRVRLGVAVAPSFVARKIRDAAGLPARDGLLVRGVEAGSSAERAGLAKGDLIVAAGGAEIDRVDALHKALDASAEAALALTVVRGTEEREVTVELVREAA
jgi:serine protease Do